jgi:hypothetical protein
MLVLGSDLSSYAPDASGAVGHLTHRDLDADLLRHWVRAGPDIFGNGYAIADFHLLHGDSERAFASAEVSALWHNDSFFDLVLHGFVLFG